MLIINPSFYYSLSKQARRGVIAHEIAHQYDQASRERLVTDLGIFVPSGMLDFRGAANAQPEDLLVVTENGAEKLTSFP